MQNHIVASFAPDATFTRNSEGAFIRLNDGKILFAFSRFTGSQSDAAPSDLYGIISADEGETWSEPELLISASLYGIKNIMSVSLLRMNNGDIGMFYCTKASPGVNRHMLSRSNDEGKTWYKHVECTLPDRPAYYVFNNDRVIRLQSGRLIMPLSYHRGGYSIDGGAYFDGRAVGVIVYSDDDGETWAEAPDTLFPPFANSGSGMQELGAVEKKNGVVWAYARTDMMYHYESYSFDGGMHWLRPQPSRFTGPCSPLQIKRNDLTGDLYAVWNPIPVYNGRETSKAGWGRIPLVWAVSKDDGVTWSEPHEIENEDGHGYCYPALFFTKDNAMLCAYCAGGSEDGICLAKLNVMKIAL